MAAALRLADKVALVTGAASGLGLAIAKRFVREGAVVFGTDLKPEQVEPSADSLADNIHWLPSHNVSSVEQWQSVFETIAESFGRLDILVNNAGITLMGDVESISIEAFNQTLDVDLKGPFLGCRIMLPLLKKQGGSIINIASVSSFKPQAELVAYNAAKAGVSLMTKSIALHCAKQKNGVRANTINPGVIRTAMLEKVINQVDDGEALMESYKQMHPIGRIGEASEIAAMATYLASEEATFITGCDFTVDGGLGIN